MKAGIWRKKNSEQLLSQIPRLPLPVLLRRQHKYLISTIILSSFTFQYVREQQYASLRHLFVLHYHTALGDLSAV